MCVRACVRAFIHVYVRLHVFLVLLCLRNLLLASITDVVLLVFVVEAVIVQEVDTGMTGHCRPDTGVTRL